MSSAPVGTSSPLISRSAAREPPRERHAARADADERDLVEAAVAFEDLVRDARQRARHPVGVHYLRHGGLRPRGDTRVQERQAAADAAAELEGNVHTLTSWRPLRAALKSSEDVYHSSSLGSSSRAVSSGERIHPIGSSDRLAKLESTGTLIATDCSSE